MKGSLASGAVVALASHAVARRAGQMRRLRKLQRQQRSGASSSEGFLKQGAAPTVSDPMLGEAGDIFVPDLAAFDASKIAQRLSLFQQLVPTSVVDCGSGSTRAICFADICHSGSEGCGPVLMRRQKSAWRGDALAQALQDEAKAERLLSLLAEKIPDGPVLVGATAGVRHALEVGAVDEAQLGVFAERLQRSLGSRARFEVLTGEEEARAEWEATCYEMSIRTGAVDPVPEDCMGMLSGGGMSCQLVLKDTRSGGPKALLSFWNRVLEPGGLVDRAARGDLTVQQLVAELPAHEALAVDAVRSIPQQHEGTFALVEWVGLYVGGKRTERDIAMGLGYERRLSQPEVLAALDRHLQELFREASKGPVQRPIAVALVYGSVIRTILSKVFGEGVSFYCLDGVGWSTGHYLLSTGLSFY